MKRLTTAALLLATTSMTLLASTAHAQDAPSAAETVDAEVPADEATGDGGEIVVTGSRTITNGNASPVPVTVVTTETLQDVRPTSLTESLNILPVFSGSRGQVSNPSATGGVGGGNGNAAQLNLRNIGSTRNLVLLDGRRVPPTSFNNIVDSDVIPQLLIQRVDVVTGGVSAVYGSDAVTGVINFITKKDFNGVKVQGQLGIAQRGDGQQREFGIAAGTSLFDGRGHIEGSYEYRNDEGVLRRSDRGFYTRPVVVGNGTTIPYQLIEFGTLSAQPFGGRITCGAACPVNGQYFASNGVLSPFVNGTTFAGTTTQSGGAGGFFDNSLKGAQRFHQLFARFDYDLTDDITFFATAGANFKRDSFFGDDVNLANITLSRSNAFLPAAIASQLPAATFTFNQILAQGETRFNPIPKSSQYIFAGGLTGKLSEFDWNVAYTRGQATLRTTLRANVNNQKLSAALDAVAGTNGQPVCFAATQAATAAAYADCVPLNLFGPTAANPAALDYILDDTLYVARNTQDNVVADIAGSPFDTWAGPVRVALSGEYRTQSFRSESENQPTQFADCTNLRFNCVATGARTFLFRQTFPASPKVSQEVVEGAFEANVPLLRDVPLVKSFDVNAAVRYTKYNTVGSYWTWKVGADWAVTDDLRIRGTLSRDIRAPTLNDLFAPTSIVIVTNPDLRPGAVQPVGGVPSVNLANPDLTAEIGKTYTVGAVYNPSFIPGLSLAVDYYNIKISNAITTVQGFQAPIQNACNVSQVQLYCDLIVRNAAGVVTSYLVRPINLAEVTTYGVDFEANYSGRLFGRPISLRGLAAWQPHIRYIQPGVPTIDQGGVAFGATGITAAPKWRLTGIFSYQVTDNFKIDILHRWRSKLALSGDPTITFLNGDDTIRPYGQTSLNVAWQIPEDRFGKAEFFVNVQNLFDNEPPAANMPGSANTPGAFGGFAVTDDPIGRFFTAGFRVKF